MLRKLFVISLVISSLSFAQFKEQDDTPTFTNGLTNSSPSGFLTSFINPSNFQMQHSVGVSYSTFGSSGVALSTYTNSMYFKLTDKLNVQVDASLVASPYSSFGQDHQNEINGIYLTHAQLNYKISENSNFSIQYINPAPGMYYNSSYSSSPFLNDRFRMFKR